MIFLQAVLRGALLLMLLLWVGGCASYSNSFAPIATELAEHDLDGALELLAKRKTPDRNRLLFLMNRGMLLRMHGEYSASNEVFREAKQLVDELNALSLREQATAITLNDATRSYAGAPYEQVMLNVYSALNYLELGKLDDARVEALQVDLRLGELADRDIGALFDTDPFARYLAAMIYEAGGELNDAMIAYRNAFESFRLHAEHYPLPLPYQLESDLLRTSEAVGLTNEEDAYRREFGVDSWADESEFSNNGELIFLFHNGLAPIKIEEAATVPVPPRGQLVRIALPAYQRRPKAFSFARLEVAGQQVATEVFADIEEMAIAELERNQPAILARATARAVMKYQMTKQAGKNNDLAGLLVNIGGLLTERADTRSWMSLPANIQLARILLAPGEYDLHVDLIDASGMVARSLDYPSIKIVAGHKQFISCHEVAQESLLRRAK